MKLIIYLFLALIIASCASPVTTLFNPNYRFHWTRSVEVYKEPSGPYLEMGYLFVEGNEYYTRERLLTELVNLAKGHGADALIRIEQWDYSIKAMMIKYYKNITHQDSLRIFAH